MRVAVYDRYWATLGGGEKYAGRLAQALAPDHEVTLLAHGPLDLDRLGERLNLDLSGVAVQIVPDSPVAVTRASAGFDLFVNASFDSTAASQATASLFVAFFPWAQPAQLTTRRRLLDTVGRLLAGEGPLVAATGGLHRPEQRRPHTVRWTDGRGRWSVEVPPGGRVPVRVVLGRYLTPGTGPVDVRLEQQGRGTVASTVLQPVESRFDRRRVVVLDAELHGTPAGEPVELVVASDTHRPCDLGDDQRTLGVPVIGVVAGGARRRRATGRLPTTLARDEIRDALDSYDRIVAISEFSRTWVQRRWQRRSDLLHPPVTSFAATTKDDVILSVGRFFPPGAFHAKRQLEMVRAFADLVRSGAGDWSLHLVGACAPEHVGYLDDVRSAAAGLPVELHVDASGRELAELYGRASIYWHAAGLGEDHRVHPERFEHFGITTVEAMSAGAVPVVFGGGGQLEVVRHGVDGYHFGDLSELVARTRRLLDDPALRAQLSTEASTAARRFGEDAFDRRTRALSGTLTRTEQ
jgi:glycosyltransferase involved in cell wall biosynthesis